MELDLRVAERVSSKTAFLAAATSDGTWKCLPTLAAAPRTSCERFANRFRSDPVAPAGFR